MNPLRIAIAGDGVAAWMAAAALAGALGRRRGSVRVVPVPSGDGPPEPFAQADTTLPWPGARTVRLPDPGDAQIARAGGAFSFGIALSGWTAPDATWFHPFGSIGAPLGPVAFHHLVERLRADGDAVRFADYALAALAAQAGRFQRPGPNPGSVLSTCAAGYHLGLKELAGICRAQAEQAGAGATRAALAGVETGADGAIAALVTAAGERVEADLYVDASGVAARLLSAMDGDERVDWSEWLPADHVVSGRIDEEQAPLPFSHAQAAATGWRRFVPLQGGGVLEQVSAGAPAEADLAQVFGPGAEPVVAPLRCGRLAQAWRGNCVALGTAAAVIDPVAVSNLQLLRSGIDRLVALLPAGPDARAERAEYNRRFAAECDNARDYAAAHYALNGRRGEAFWDARRAAPLPDSLAWRLELYAATGRVALYDDEPLEESAWLCLLDEHGVHPGRVHPMAAGVAAADGRRHLERIRAVMIETLRGMPLHAEALAALRSGRT